MATLLMGLLVTALALAVAPLAGHAAAQVAMRDAGESVAVEQYGSVDPVDRSRPVTEQILPVAGHPGTLNLGRSAATGRGNQLSGAGALVVCAAMLGILFTATFVGGRQRRPGRRSSGRAR